MRCETESCKPWSVLAMENSRTTPHFLFCAHSESSGHGASWIRTSVTDLSLGGNDRGPVYIRHSLCGSDALQESRIHGDCSLSSRAWDRSEHSDLQRGELGAV